MNLESVSMLYASAGKSNLTKSKILSEQAVSGDLSKFGVCYEESVKQSRVEAIPSDTYNGMIKNVKNISCPYEYLADQNGTIEYNGVIFQCDTEQHALCLGDMSEVDNILTIPLTEGGVLKVNRDYVGALGRAIGLFSPQDVKRIMQALAIDAKVHSKEYEVEKEENDTCESLCDGEENT